MLPMPQERKLIAFLTGVLSAVAICALAATGAQASGSEWMSEGETFEQLKVEKETTSLSGGPLSISVPEQKLTIECTNVEGSGTIVKSGTDTDTLTLSKCKVTPAACEVTSITMKLKGEDLTVGPHEKLQGQESVIATVLLKGETCPLSPEQKLTGAVADETQTREKEEEADKKLHLAF